MNSSLRSLHSAPSRGYTLLELVVVVSIISVLAAVALPSVGPSEDQKLDLAAAHVADAIRFARTEALRTGEGHGVTISQSTQTVTVNRYDLTTAPVTAGATLINPFDKQPYDINISTAPGIQGVNITNTQDVFSYTGLGRRQSLIYDANGTPIWADGAGPTMYLLGDGTVELGYGSLQQVVRVASITGRVTIE